jgi:hypothetical protein
MCVSIYINIYHLERETHKRKREWVDVAYNERKVAKYGKMRHVEAKQNFV